MNTKNDLNDLNRENLPDGNINDLKPLTDNPMKHPKRNRETTKKAIEEVGFARSIVVNGEKTILAGHGTVEACKDLGIDKVRYIQASGDEIIAIVRDDLDEEGQYRLAMFDNAAAKQAMFDGEALEKIRFKRGVSTEGIFTEAEFDKFITKEDNKQIIPEDEDEGPVGATGYFIIVECDDKNEQEVLFETLTGDGYNVVKYEGNKRGEPNGKNRSRNEE
jgi:hypothetical protein